MRLGDYDTGIYRQALEAFLANEKTRAGQLAKNSSLPEAKNLLARLSPQPPATPEQVAGYGDAFDAFNAGDEKTALSLAEAIKSMPEAARLIARIKNSQGVKE